MQGDWTVTLYSSRNRCYRCRQCGWPFELSGTRLLLQVDVLCSLLHRSKTALVSNGIGLFTFTDRANCSPPRISMCVGLTSSKYPVNRATLVNSMPRLLCGMEMLQNVPFSIPSVCLCCQSSDYSPITVKRSTMDVLLSPMMRLH